MVDGDLIPESLPRNESICEFEWIVRMNTNHYMPQIYIDDIAILYRIHV